MSAIFKGNESLINWYLYQNQLKLNALIKNTQNWEKFNWKSKKMSLNTFNNIILINPLNLLKLKVPIIGMMCNKIFNLQDEDFL